MTTISAVIIVKNEEKNIVRCLDSLSGSEKIVDEIVILDSFSEDQTSSLCKKYNVRFLQRKWEGYSAAKNFANQEATQDYIFSIDADEAVSQELHGSILALKKKGMQGVYSMNRRTNYCGKWIRHLGWYPDRAVRLFPRGTGKWAGLVHEHLEFLENFTETKLKGDLYHYSYSSFTEHRQRADKYSLLKAQKMYAQGKRADVFTPFLSAVGRLLRMYIFKAGFLEAYYGLVISIISAQSNYVKYSELRRLRKIKATPHYERILISRTDSIGDVVLTLPLAGILKEKFPQAAIYFLGSGYTKDIVESCKNIDYFLVWDDDLEKRKELFQRIKKLSLDAVIHAFPRRQLARIFSKAHVPVRVGTGRRWYHWFYCNRLPNFTRRGSLLHEAELNIKLLCPLQINETYSLNRIPAYYGLSKNTLENTLGEKHKNLLASCAQDRFRLVLHPRSRGSAAEWPLKNYADLIGLLPQNRFYIFLTGTEEEGKEFRPAMPFQENVYDLSGQLSLKELLSWLSQMDAVTASSTGPLHIAAALGICAVGLYSPRRPAHPGRWGPLGKKAHVMVFDSDCPLCRQSKPCKCIEKISPHRVAEFLLSLRAAEKH